MLTVDDAASIAILKEYAEMLVNNNVIEIIGQDFLILKHISGLPLSYYRAKLTHNLLQNKHMHKINAELF